MEKEFGSSENIAKHIDTKMEMGYIPPPWTLEVMGRLISDGESTADMLTRLINEPGGIKGLGKIIQASRDTVKKILAQEGIHIGPRKIAESTKRKMSDSARDIWEKERIKQEKGLPSRFDSSYQQAITVIREKTMKEYRAGVKFQEQKKMITIKAQERQEKKFKKYLGDNPKVALEKIVREMSAIGAARHLGISYGTLIRWVNVLSAKRHITTRPINTEQRILVQKADLLGLLVPFNEITQDILRNRFLSDTPETHATVGIRHNLSRESIRLKEKKALKILNEVLH